MKRKILSLITTLFLTLGVALSSCSNTNTSSSSSSTTTSNHEHTFSSSYEYDETYHWHPSTCGHDIQGDKERHIFSSFVTEPTYEHGGYTTYTCSTCGYSYTDEEVDALPITITWKNYDGTVLEVDNNVPYGTMPSYDGEIPTKESDSNYDYLFAGWTPDVVKATKPATYVATFSSEEITYTIDFDLNGGTSNSYNGPIEIKTLSNDVFFFDCVKEGWSFRGWEYQNEKIFDEKGNQLKNVTLVDNMVFKAIYTQTVKLTIVSNIPEAGVITGEGEYPYNTYVDVSAMPNQGYKFIGWYYQGTLLSNTTEYKYMMRNQDITLEARFELDYFTMRVYSNSEEHGLVLLRSNSNFNYLPEYQEQRKYTSNITIAAYSKTDVRFLGWYDENNQLVTTNAEYTFVMPNHDYTLEAKWNYFEITYNLNGGVNNENNPTSYSIDDDNIKLLAPTKEGYEFVGWKYNDEFIDEINANTIDDITLEAVWSSYKYAIKQDSNGNKYASIIDFDDSIAEVHLPSEVVVDSESIPVKEIGSRAFKDNATIISITIPDSVTTIGNSAFRYCFNLTTVTIGENSQLTSIGDYAFYNCDSLTSITIPDSVTTIGNSAFVLCSNLTTVTFGENSQLTSIGSYAFYNCDSLTSITIPDSVTSIGDYAFYWCSNLTTVTFGENSQLTSIGSYAFYNCDSLTSITIPDSVTSIGSYAFNSCSSLTSIIIPSSVTTIGDYAFALCSNLTIYCEAASQPSGWDSWWSPSNRPVVWVSGDIFVDGDYAYVVRTSGEERYVEIVTYLGSGGEVVIPDTINVDGANIPVTTVGNYAFSNNDTITSVTIGNNVTTIGDNAFYYCSSLTSITIPNGVTTIGSYAFYLCSNLTTVTFGENSQLTSIGSDAFYNCDSLTSITIPNSVTSIGDYAFYWCSNLTIYCEAASKPSGWSSSWNYSNRPVVWVGGDIIVDGDYAYVVRADSEERYVEIVRYLGSEEKVIIPNTINVDGEEIKVTTIGNSAFRDCSSITSITIPDNVTTIGSFAFAYCSSLTIYCEAASQPSGWNSNWNPSNRPVVWDCLNAKTTEDGLVYHVYGNEDGTKYIVIDAYIGTETDVLIPDTINVNGEDIPVTTIADKAFSNNYKITSVTIGNNVTTIGYRAFSGCSSLTTVTFGENSQLTSIGSSAFYNCSSLTSIFIPDSVTSIGNYAFENCSNLTTVTFGENSQLTSIGEWAFYNCSSLTSITIPDSVTSIGSDAFSGCSSLTIYCEVTSEPSGWNSDWNPSNRPVVWDCLNAKTTEDGLVYHVYGNEDGTKYIVIEAYVGTETEVVIPDTINVGGEEIKVTTIDSSAFSNCSPLTSITIPDSVTSIGSRAFSGCSSLTTVTFGENSQLTTIGSRAFSGCSSLTSITIPDSVTSIGNYAFSGCSSLTTVTFGENSQLTSIGDYAFYDCWRLTSIIIPNSVTSIGSRAFYNCSNLTIYCEATSEPDGWAYNWNYSNRPVVWGYVG